MYNYNLKFEGEYLNGEKNRKVKEYDYRNNGKLRFEGEYLYGKRHGKGKEYYDSGKLKFEGEYLYGRKLTGKGYNDSTDIIYELKDGKGEIKEYYDNGKLEFEGEYLNGKRSGKGKEYNVYGQLIF